MPDQIIIAEQDEDRPFGLYRGAFFFFGVITNERRNKL